MTCREPTGAQASGPLATALELAREWAGPSCRALLLSGSHASGEAIWIEEEGRSLSISDVDLYAILSDANACRAAASRRRAATPGLASRLRALGLAAPLEVAFLTARDLARLPARPATLELARGARVIAGDAAALRLVPAYRADQITGEEMLLLLENRAFELLAAHASLDATPLERRRARHEVLKCALDLAGVLCLAAGEYPVGAAARVERARRGGGFVPGLDALWERALAWRREPIAWASPEAARAEWQDVVRAWAAVWDRLATARGTPGRTAYERAVALAGRARIRRRVRQALQFPTRSGAGPDAWERLRFALRGTPQHRLNASAVLLLLAAAAAGGADAPPTLPEPARRALRALGVLQSRLSFGAAAAAAVRLWDQWVLDGQRTAEPA